MRLNGPLGIWILVGESQCDVKRMVLINVWVWEWDEGFENSKGRKKERKKEIRLEMLVSGNLARFVGKVIVNRHPGQLVFPSDMLIQLQPVSNC